MNVLRSHFSSIQDLSLHARVAGAGNPILCISGFGCSSYNFEWMWPELSRTGTAVLMDNRGMGKSAHASGEYELDDLAIDAHLMMKSLGFGKYHIVGISMGGMIAQLLALQFPQSVLSLSLLCTSSGGPRFLTLPPLDIDMLRKFYQIPEPQRSSLAMPGLVHPTLPTTDPKLFERIVQLRRDNSANLEQIILQKKAVDRFLNRNLPLESIRTPTFVLSGDSDRFVNPENSNRLSKIIPNSNLDFVPDTDHYFFLENAGVTGAKVNHFIQSVTDHLAGANL